MAKSFSQKKKEVLGHVDFISNTLHKAGASVAVLDAYRKSLKDLKKESELSGWFRGYTKRVGEVITHYPKSAPLINDQRKSIERIIGSQL